MNLIAPGWLDDVKKCMDEGDDNDDSNNTRGCAVNVNAVIVVVILCVVECYL